MTCTVDGCGNGGPYRKGLCDPHYWKNYRYGDPLHDPRPPVPEGMKRCSVCAEVKARAEFHVAAATKSGYRSACKSCANERDRQRDRKRPRQPEPRRRRVLKTYGLTVKDYDAMLAKQGGCCGCCGKPETEKDHRTGATRSLAVDHCHSSGAVRGLLCRKCNHALGLLGDTLDDAQRLVAYLTRGHPLD